MSNQSRLVKKLKRPRYAVLDPTDTFLERLLEEKWRIGQEIKAKMNEHYSTIVKDALPLKEKDQGSFTLPCTINNMCFDKALADLGASVSVMPYSTFTNLGLGTLAPTKLIIELVDKTVKRPKGIAENVLVGIDKFVFLIDFIVLNMPKDTKIPLILGIPFLSTAHAKVDVFKRKFALRIGNYKIVFKSDNLTSNIIKKMEDLDPTIEEGEGVDEPMKDIGKTRHDNETIEGIDEYHRYEHVTANFFPVLSINVMSINFYNSIMKDKVEYKGKNVVGAFIDVPIFVGNFSIVTDFAVVENMDAYRKDMRDIIVGKPFCRDACVEARQFDGFITIHNGNDSVTNPMVRSHPRFKHLSNDQCNKIKPLLKVSACDKLDGVLHPYQKLKGFFKGVLNFGTRIHKEREDH
ncbi:putative reverse transcriptase domain-containing protein [Tanacetum coccineum]